MNTNQQMSDYYQILANGKILQWKTCGVWRDISVNYELRLTEEYREKPEPVVIYINKPDFDGYFVYKNKEAALRQAISRRKAEYEYIAKKFIEAD